MVLDWLYFSTCRIAHGDARKTPKQDNGVSAGVPGSAIAVHPQLWHGHSEQCTLGGMFTNLTPGQPLGQWVEIIWDCDGFNSHHHRELRLPTLGAELVFNLEDTPIRFADLGSATPGDRAETLALNGATRLVSLSGPHTRPFVLDTSRPLVALGVHLRPIALASLFRVNAAELRNRHLPLEDLLGVHRLDVWYRLREAATAGQRIQIVSEWLIERLTGSPQPHWAVLPALRRLRQGIDKVQIIANAAGLSERRLGTVFCEQTGLGPKMHARLRRFHRAIDNVSGTTVNWARLASDAGYYDQSHLIRDFKYFSGLTPQGYLLRKTAHVNHVALAAPATVSDSSNPDQPNVGTVRS